VSNSKVSEGRVKKPTLRINESRFFSFLREDVLDVYQQSLRQISTCYGLEIDHNSVRLVKLNHSENKILKASFDKEVLGDKEEMAFEKAFENLFKRNKYKGEEISLLVSSDLDVLNKVIQIDLKSEERLEQWILANRMEVFPPLTQDDIYYDYFVLENGQSKKQLCLSLVRKEKLDLIIKIAEKYHLNLTSITAGSFTLHGWLRENGLITDEEPIIVILKGASAEVLFYEKELPVFVSEIPVELGLNNSNLDDFCSSFNELLKHHYGEEVSFLDKKVLFLGEPSATKNLEDKLGEEGFVSIAKDIPLNFKNLKNGSIPPEFVPLYSLVSRPLSITNTTVNLLPLDKRKNDDLSKGINRIFNFSLKFTLISLAILVVLNLGLGFYLNQNQDKLTLFESKMKLINDLRKENQHLQEKTKSVSNLLTNQSKKAQLLSIVNQLSPQGVWLRNMSNESQQENSENRLDQIYLNGLSFSESEVSHLVANLERSKYFKEIKVAFLDRVSYQDTRGIPGKYRNSLFKFKIEMRSEI